MKKPLTKGPVKNKKQVERVDILNNKIPRKKLPFVKDADPRGKDFCLDGSNSNHLEESLRGEIGYQAIFMPTPGLLPYRPPRATTPAVDKGLEGPGK